MKNRARLHFLDALKKIRNLHPELRFEGPIVCAVSGGVDSICLLALADDLAASLDITPIVAHLNHAVRNSANRDEEFVRTVALERRLQFYSDRLPSPPLDRNLEAWMREERYRFLERVRSETGASLIFTAHHAADQEETLLMHLLSNRLPKGKSVGIRLYDPLRHVLRPLLDCTKEELLDYATQSSLNWIEDESNLDLNFLRNRIRLSVLPFLRENLNPGLDQALRSLADRLSTDEEVISAGLPSPTEFMKKVEGEDQELVGIKLRALMSYPVAIRWRLLRNYLHDVSPEIVDRISFARLFSIVTAMSEYPDKLVVFELGGGVLLELGEGGVLRVRIEGS